MAAFKIVLLEHGYETTRYEREIIEAAGGQFVDCEQLPLEEALQEAADADGVIFRRIDMNRSIIARFKQAQIILRYGIGTDNVDLDACTELGIIAGHVPGYCIDDVSTHAIALLTSCMRNVVGNHQAMEQGAWDLQRTNRLYRTEGRTLGLIGFGGIGQSMARKLSGWGLRIVASDPFVDPAKADLLGVDLVPLPDLLATADYLSLHAPHLPETHHILNDQAFAHMKPGVMIVNTARGPLIKETALLKALDDGIVSRAGLDVFEEEPLAKTSPLRSHPKVTISDHTAWYSEESQVILQQTAAEEMVRVCTGNLPHSLANVKLIQQQARFKNWQPPDLIQWQLKRLAQLPGA